MQLRLLIQQRRKHKRIKYNNFMNRHRKGNVICAILLGGIIGVNAGIAPISVQAAVKWTQFPENDDFYPGAQYTEDSARYVYVLPKNATTKNGCKVVAYFGEPQKIKLPGKIGDYKVTNLGKAFSTLTSIQTMTIPSGYTTIESQAFYGLSQVYRVSIPASVENIADDAFTGCDKNKLTIVAPYGSYAEQYTLEHGIQYSNSTSVKIQPNGTSMYVGEQKRIGVLNTNKDATWKSSKSSVATVDASGLVQANKAGTTKITATIGSKTYSYTFKVLARTQANVLKVVWDNFVTSTMSDYEKALAAEQWVATHIDASGTSSSVKTALESGKVSYTGRANTYKKILEHYGLKVKVVKGSKHVENSVVIAGKTYKVSALSKVQAADKQYTTTPFGVAINKSTMNLSVGGTDTFKALGTKQKVIYSSSNKKVATVTAGGKVTAKKAGTATVTMKMGAKTYKLRVRVNK